MARRFVKKRTHRFRFTNEAGESSSYVLIFGDEVSTSTVPAPSGGSYRSVRYRGRLGEWVPPPLSTQRPTEMYFLDVGQGDAAFIVTPNDTKILVDGGLQEIALGFLIWKYRLDVGSNQVVIDHLFLSHADKDHVEGLIPVLRHPRITVRNIYHNGIGLFDSGFNTKIGQRSGGRLTTVHSSTHDLHNLDLASGRGAAFAKWITAVRATNAHYERLDRSRGVLDVGDPDIQVEITGPIHDPSDGSLPWMRDVAHTINGNSLTFRYTHGNVRAFFSGDLNIEGSAALLAPPDGPLNVNAHILKAPHHGSHEFSEELFAAVHPMITVISSGEVPDHGHPRANFLGTIGRSGRGPEPLVFSTELAALFVDTHDPEAVAAAGSGDSLDSITFAEAQAAEAHQRFKKVLPGIINVRTDGEAMYAFRRVQQGYQWESYGPIHPVV